MSTLKLVNIRKTYKAGNTTVKALKGVSLEFRKSEFVSILGPSGCGKTTLLNIIGGLDRYDQGDLVINDLSTKHFRDSDWDAYRNRSIGFVFQNYNLITHQTVLQNVEIAMTLSGVSRNERKRRAKEALEAVGLGDQLNKKPGQMSGGQMQRVAIARALVNQPDIILADEPTGALDSHTSVQVMEILKEISKTRLVIMVTHNGELADAYSNRVIRLLDGEVQSDSNPIENPLPSDKQPISTDNGMNKDKRNKTSMSLLTATSLSFKNLLTKKGRTMITSFAGSIGIIGVALVLALSNGLSGYISKMQSETLSGFPITITTSEQSIDSNDERAFGANANSTLQKYPNDNIIVRYKNNVTQTRHKNVLTTEYLDYITAMSSELPDAVRAISYTRGVEMNVLAKGDESVVKFNTSTSNNMQAMMRGGGNRYWQEMPNNADFILSLYDLIGDGSRLPSAKNEVAFVVDEYNRIDDAFFQRLGIFNEKTEYLLTDFIGKTILKVIPNNDFYSKDANGIFIPASPAEYNDLYTSDHSIELTITGILRIKDNASSSFLSPGIVYTAFLTDEIVNNAEQSEIASAQKSSNIDVLLNTPFSNEEAKEQKMHRLGAITTPTGINIYPKDFASKESIKQYLDAYNTSKTKENRVIYNDLAESVTSMVGTLLNTVTYVLVGFAAISLIVSTIMIGIITYVSVIERTKEIGILRSVGARKKDVSRVFNAETLIVGFTAGLLGVGISYLLTIPINKIIDRLVAIQGIANLTLFASIMLIIGSMLLTLIAGLIPARMAAKKDPVIALRTE